MNKEKSFQDAIIFLRLLLIPVGCYFIFFKNYKILNYFFFIIFLTVIIVSVDTLYQFLNYNSEKGFGSDIFGFKSDWYGRLTGPFGNELVPGSYVSKFGLIGFVYLLKYKKLYKNIPVLSIYLSMILIVTFISGERMAFATFTLGLLVLLFFLNKKRLTILISLIIGLLSIFLIYKLHPFYNDFKVIDSTEYHQGLKIEKSFPCPDNDNEICKKILNIQPNFFKVIKNFSTSAYGEIYLLSLKMFKENFITGIGISNFQYACKNFQKYKTVMINYNCASHPHNIYLQWLAEGGLIIFSFFIIYLFYLSKRIIKNKGNYEYKLISLTTIVIMFWPIMSTGSLIKNWYGILTFFIIGICLSISNFRKNY